MQCWLQWIVHKRENRDRRKGNQITHKSLWFTYTPHRMEGLLHFVRHSAHLRGFEKGCSNKEFWTKVLEVQKRTQSPKKYFLSAWLNRTKSSMHWKSNSSLVVTFLSIFIRGLDLRVAHLWLTLIEFPLQFVSFLFQKGKTLCFRN